MTNPPNVTPEMLELWAKHLGVGDRLRLRVDFLDDDKKHLLAGNISVTKGQYPEKLALVARDESELREKLGRARSLIEKLREGESIDDASGISLGWGREAGRIAFLFPGQGSQFADMGAELAMTFPSFRAVWDRAAGIDRKARLVHLAGRPPLPYDLAAIDVGITSDLPSLPGAADHAVAAKPLGRYAEAWEAFVAAPPALPRVVILGAGLGGVELALASAHRLRKAGATVTLLDRAEAFLPTQASSAWRVLERRLAAAG